MAWMEHPHSGRKVRTRYNSSEWKSLFLLGYKDVTPPRSAAQTDHVRYRQRLGTIARVKAQINEILFSDTYPIKSIDKLIFQEAVYRLEALEKQVRDIQASKRQLNKNQGGG